MADFRVWGRIDHIGPSQFFVIVSAVHSAPAEYERPDVRTGQAASLEEAEAVKCALLVELGQTVRARGDRVVDVEGE